jgi:hypothetical protein
VAPLGEARALQHVADFAADYGDLEDAHAVGREGIETEEAPLAGRLALSVEPLHADVVEVGGPVHGRARVGLGKVEEVGRVGEPSHLGRQLGEAERMGLLARLPQDA